MTGPARYLVDTSRSVLVLLRWAAVWALLGFLVALTLLVSRGEADRYQFMSVLSGSMVPTLDVGDLLVARIVTADEMAAGELVTFHDPGSGRLVTHRVQSILWRGDIADVITRGDHNTVGEEWSIRADGRVGQAVLRVPRAGYVVGILGTPAGQLGLAGVALVLGVWILVVIWRPSPAAPAGAAPSPDGQPELDGHSQDVP